MIKVHSGAHSAISMTAFGTTSATTITVGQVRPLYHFPSRDLVLNKVVIVSGQLGSFNATSSELNGSMTQINNTVNSLEFDQIGPNAQIKVNGDVGTFSANQVNLGPLGQVVISPGTLGGRRLAGSRPRSSRHPRWHDTSRDGSSVQCDRHGELSPSPG